MHLFVPQWQYWKTINDCLIQLCFNVQIIIQHYLTICDKIIMIKNQKFKYFKFSDDIMHG